MKMRYLLGILLTGWFCAACHEEEDIIPRVSPIEFRYEFPQGNKEWDRIANGIYEQYGVCLIYKDIDSLDFRRSWTNTLNYIYRAQPVSEAQAAFQIRFMQEQVFKYIPREICRQLLLVYYYLLADFQQVGSYATTSLINYTGGIDFWVSSMFTAATDDFPDALKQKEYRVRIFKQIFELGFKRQKILMPKEFNEGFDYTTPLIFYPETDKDFYKKRGFPGKVTGDVYNFSTPYSMLSAEENFISYLFLCLRYTEEEFIMALPPADFPLIANKRTWMLNYIKEKYGFDLAAIAAGPE